MTSQYQCRTCENRECIWHIENPHAYSGIPPYKRRTMGSCAAEQFSAVVGCTRHSNFVTLFEKLLSDISNDAQVVNTTMHTNRDYVVKISDVEYHIKEAESLVKKK